MACQRVFNTTELLESILLLLRLPDLLRVQAVCKQWQEVITRSSALQEKLFFRPTKKDSAWLVDVINLPSGMRPLHRRYETHVRIRGSVPLNSAERKSHHGLSVTPVQINPLCLRRLVQTSNLDIDANYGTPVVLHPKFDELKCQEHGSWQNMLLTSPPVQHVTLESGPTKVPEFLDRLLQRISVHRNFSSDTVTSKIFVESGVRFRHITSEMNKLVRSDSANVEGHAIYMHGAIGVTDSDVELVRGRTKKWRDGHTSLHNWALA